MAHYQFMDELVREYVLFRGFTNTLKAFDLDLKAEKEKGFRVDKILDTINQFVVGHDLTGLLELWRHFDTRIFCRLETSKVATVKKLENSLLKLYLVNCHNTKQQDKLKEFFERMAPDLQGQSEWKDWFALPFLPSPQENPAFSVYFTRQWQDTLMLSLHNFLALVFQGLPPPRLADYKKTASRLTSLRKEVRQLKLRLAAQGDHEDPLLAAGNTRNMEAPQGKEIMDDFYLIAQEAAVVDTQVKSIKSFLRTITGVSAGGGEKKKSPVQPAPQARSRSRGRSVVSKQPLKRVTQSVNPLAKSGSEVPSEPQDQGEQQTQVTLQHLDKQPDQGSTTNFTTQPDQSTTIATPCSSSRYLLLGQEEYSEHRSPLLQLCVSTAGGRVVSCDQSGVVKVWSPTPSPQTLATFISGSPVSCVCWLEGSDRYFLYGTTTGQVRLCDVTEKMSIAEVSPDLVLGQPVALLLSAPSGASFLCCAGQASLLLDTRRCGLERDLTNPLLSPVACAAFNHNGSVLVHGSTDGKLGLTDPNRGELLASWDCHDSPVSCLRISKDQTKVWSLDREGSLSLSSILHTGQKLWCGVLLGDTSHLRTRELGPDFSLSPDGEHVLVGSATGGVIYQLPGPEGGLEKVLGLRGEHPSTATCWSQGDCGPSFTGGTDGTVNIYTLLCQ